jgi:hypothetical protein
VSAIAITGATAATALTITGKGGNGLVDVGGLTSATALKSITAKSANLTGTLNLSGAVGTLSMGKSTDGTITIGGAATDKPVAITLGDAVGTDVTSVPPIKSVNATSLAVGTNNARGTITAPSLDKRSTKGDMTENLSVVGVVKTISVGGDLAGTLNVDSVNSVSVKGDANGAQIRSSRAFNASEKAIGKVSVGGALGGTLVLATGNIGTVTAGSSSGSAVYAGVAGSILNALGTLPAAATDFANQAAIRSVSFKTSTASTEIAASTLGKISLGAVTLVNNGTAFGVAADEITSLSGSTAASGPRLTLKKLDTQDDVTEQTNGADLQDFKVVLV